MPFDCSSSCSVLFLFLLHISFSYVLVFHALKFRFSSTFLHAFIFLYVSFSAYQLFLSCLKIYYSKFDKHHYIDFHWVQRNEPTTLALGNFQCFSLISTKFAVVIAIPSSYRFNCKSYTGWALVCPFVGNCKILLFTEKCIIFKW